MHAVNQLLETDGSLSYGAAYGYGGTNGNGGRLQPFTYQNASQLLAEKVEKKSIYGITAVE
jgi:hypothetical protein